MIVLRSPRRRRRAGRRRVLLLFFGTYAEEPAAVVDGAKGVVGGRVQRVHRVHRLLFEHAERAPAVHPVDNSVLRSRSRNYLRSGAGTGAEIIFLINISCSQFGEEKPPLRHMSYDTGTTVHCTVQF